MDADVRLDALVRQVRDLPALPAAVLRVMQTADDPKASASDVARALSSDQALAARVLKLANSAFYGANRRIGTVSEAVVILGLRTTRNLAMATSCEDMLEREVTGYAMQRGALWRHSLACASAAQALAAARPRPGNRKKRSWPACSTTSAKSSSTLTSVPSSSRSCGDPGRRHSLQRSGTGSLRL